MGVEDGDDDAKSEEDEDALLFDCFIFREPFVDPVVTKLQALLLWALCFKGMMMNLLKVNYDDSVTKHIWVA